LLCLVLILGVAVIHADVITRIGVRGTAPMPGTQQQELSNITFPAPYNVFEFLVTCAACHGGQVDQQVAHFGNWAGTAMASAARDPVFRANQIIANSQLQQLSGQPGGGNMCFRCHSPNGWYSGRFDPNLNGASDGSQMLHSIVLSTDDEGISCEQCHRTMGAARFKRTDLNTSDPAWNIMAGISDWPHSGIPYVDQFGDPTIAPGDMLGDATLQIDEGMTYIGRYPGTADIYWSDLPIVDINGTLGGNYTGQTYGIYPPGWIDMQGNDVGGKPATAAGGELLVQLDIPIGPPLNPDGSPCYSCQSVSPEHSTIKYPNMPPAKGFIQTSEFCGACHGMNIPVMNNGMPVQRTYTEWKYSAFGGEGPDHKSCQDCHMPRLSHEYNDEIPGSFNADPYGEPGGWPYSKPRTNTAVHKLAGANRGLPKMMKALYPEADFEVIGGAEGGGGVWVGTGNDTRIFPGMLSNRDSMFERNRRNTEISLQDGVEVQISQAPVQSGTATDGSGIYEVKVKVTNNTGHLLPSGFAAGRRMWVNLAVSDAAGVVYRSGYYDQASARLFTDATMAGLNRSLSNVIDATTPAQNAVMIYERVTGTCDDTVSSCTPSFGVLNDFILFDNRIPPMGFTYADYRQAGVKFWNYDPATFTPTEESDRYPDGQNWDEITYRFSAPAGLTALSARAEVLFQSHSREFMEYLRTADTSTVRPEGPLRVWSPNYPLVPNFLSEEFGLDDVSAEITGAGFIAEPLRDNWGGLAYGVWYATGKGEPFLAAVADSAAAPPAAVVGLSVSPQCGAGGCTGGVINPDTGVLEPYTQVITWSPVPGADGYLVWIKYGAGLTTASWDKLAIVPADPAAATLQLVNTALNVDKTYGYRVQAFNGAGFGPQSGVVYAKTPWDLPLPPENLKFEAAGPNWIQMSWYDGADNEDGWKVFRQDVPSNNLGFELIATFPSDTGFGGVSFTDGGTTQPSVEWADGYLPPVPGNCYVYVVEAYNTSGNSGWNVNGPVQMCTAGVPGAPANLAATAVSGTQIDLTWTAAIGTVDGYRVERSTNNGTTWTQVATGLTLTSYSDTGLTAGATYWYRVFAYNAQGDSLASNVASATTPGGLPAAPSGFTATPSVISPDPPFVTLAWIDNATNEQNFRLERALASAGPYTVTATLGSSAGTGGSVTYVDTTVQPKMTYWYRVAATNASGASPYAGPLSGVTPGEIPQQPENLRVTKTQKNAITLAWDDRSDNELGFNIQRSTGGGAWITVGTVGANKTGYKDNGLTSKTTYSYRVQAYNADGVSGFSNTAVGTTK
jgi:fibronectin type 3 domain-containing protein